MATEIERLVLRMEANVRGYERALARAQGQTSAAMRRIERDTADTASRVERAFSGVSLTGITAGARGLASALGPAAAALGTLLSVEGLRQSTDAAIRATNALKVAGLEGAELARVYQELFDVAQRQGQPVENLTQLYGSLSQAQGDLKVSSQQIVGLVEATGQALRVSGVPASQASGAILGLSQALSGGTVRAEEFNQMLEGGLRPALQAAANGLEEAGGSIGKLRQLVTEGEVSSRAFFAAIEAGQPALATLADRAQTTSDQALQRLKNELGAVAKAIDEATGFSQALAGGINAVADAAGRMAQAISRATGPLQRYIDTAKVMLGLMAEPGAQAREPLIVDVNGRILSGGGPTEGQLEAQREANRGRALGAVQPPIRPVSLAAFPTEGGTSGGGGGRSGAERVSDYQREVEALNARRAAIELDIEVFGRSAEAISKAKVEQQLLNALQKDGVTVTAEQREKVSQLAQQFADTEARLKGMKDAQTAFNEAQRFIGSTLSSFFSDVVSGGKNAEKALMNLAKRLADTALQAVLLGDGPLAGVLGLKGKDGGIGGLIGALFGGFRAAGGPVSSGRGYVVGENGPEWFQPAQSGRIFNSRQMRGGGTYAPVYNIDARGADAGAVARIERSLAERDRTESTRHAASQRLRDVRNVRP